MCSTTLILSYSRLTERRTALLVTRPSLFAAVHVYDPDCSLCSCLSTRLRPFITTPALMLCTSSTP
ncbi:hypothetical protein E2C01_091137 [Portunus trituberculatus]|uniref:Uncharacterized protein n=1 Tax=Portunus trituberculatus TaxID=210409 RepID=A0A5B7JS74_PORTR|nr:hypothetical protein [Portunus trituberculatus]